LLLAAHFFPPLLALAHFLGHACSSMMVRIGFLILLSWIRTVAQEDLLRYICGMANFAM
jgi:hypothetical protein